MAIRPADEALRVGQILRETGATLAIVEGEEQLDKLLGVRADCPALRQIVIIDIPHPRDISSARYLELRDGIFAQIGLAHKI